MSGEPLREIPKPGTLLLHDCKEATEQPCFVMGSSGETVENLELRVYCGRDVWHGHYLPQTCYKLPSPDYRNAALRRRFVNYSFFAPDFTIGCDPEIFLGSEGALLPAFHFLPGPKERRAIFWDGFQAEFRTRSDACLERLVSTAARRLRTLLRSARALRADAQFISKSVVEVPKSLLRDAAAEHVALGCNPSLNAYSIKGRPVKDGRRLPIRFAGGHLHFGLYDKRNCLDQLVEGVKALDALVGVLGVVLARDFDDPRRRIYYGLAGEYRLPKHGLEYRTLSNFWLCHPALMHLTFDVARVALRLGLNGLRTEIRVDEGAVTQAINENDHQLAERIMLENEALWGRILRSLYGNNCFSRLLAGPSAFGIDMSTIESNWRVLTTFGSML